LDEAELIGAAKAGDRRAFDELVRRTFMDTFTLARRLTGNEEDGRDVVQDAYLRAWRGIGKFRGRSVFYLCNALRHCEHAFLGGCQSERNAAGAQGCHHPLARALDFLLLRRPSLGTQYEGLGDFFQIAVNLTALQIVVTPQPLELPRVHAGQTASIVIADTPGSTAGKVREIKAGQVFIDFSSPSLSIRPGMSAQVKIKVL